MRKTQYEIIDTVDKLLELDEILRDDTGKFLADIISVDTETNGLRHYADVIIGWSLSIDSETGFYIPLLKWIPDPESKKVRSVNKVSRTIFIDGYFEDIWRPNVFYPEKVTQKEYKPPQDLIDIFDFWLKGGASIILHNAIFDITMINSNFGIDISEFVFCDTMLLHHAINENESHGLKEVASEWKRELGFDADQAANQEQLELGESVLNNGGTFNSRTKHIWRADYDLIGKYACADTCLTFGVFEVGIEKLPEHLHKWFFEDEIMPLCVEVLTPMRQKGVPIDVNYFKELEVETKKYLDLVEDDFMKAVQDENLLEGFDIGKSIDESVPKKVFLEKLIELEGLKTPTLEKKIKAKNGEPARVEIKESFSKKAVEKAYDSEPHWLWLWLLGQDELKYSDEKVKQIKDDLYCEREGKRYRFNIRSDMHLRWLFCDKLGHSRESLPQTDSATPKNPIPSMKAEVLEEHFLSKYKWVKYLLTYKKIHKLWSTYINGILERQFEGRIYTSFLPHGTTSGRLASRDPNLQNLPAVEEIANCPNCDSENVIIEKPCSAIANLKCKECGKIVSDIICSSIIKRGFIAGENHKIVNSDFASLEPKCFSEQSGDPKLKEIWANNLDLYCKVHIDMYQEYDKYSADPKDENFLKKKNNKARKAIKPIVLGIPYGMRHAQVANVMNLKLKKVVEGIEVEVLDYEKGKEMRDLYLDTYPGLRQYMEDCHTKALTQGYVETLFGRRRHFKYAPVLGPILDRYEIDIESFLDCSKRHMRTPIIKSLGLNGEDLREFVEATGLEWWKVKEKENWVYVKNLVKNELNNACNFPIQGLAAHITNRSMIELVRKMKSENINGYAGLQVHDEITTWVHDDYVEKQVEILQSSMENNMYTQEISIPMKAEPIICDTLDKAK